MTTMRNRIDEIYAGALPEMQANNIPDTLENRKSFLEGIRDSWNEDPMHSLDKCMYIIAINLEIGQLKRKIIPFAK